jgi:hypothetical protein
LPISRVDANEASTCKGVRFGEISSMFSIRLQSYGRFPNISLSATFPLFPFISLHFTGIEKSIEKAFILQTERADNRSNKRSKGR